MHRYAKTLPWLGIARDFEPRSLLNRFSSPLHPALDRRWGARWDRSAGTSPALGSLRSAASAAACLPIDAHRHRGGSRRSCAHLCARSASGSRSGFCPSRSKPSRTWLASRVRRCVDDPRSRSTTCAAAPPRSLPTRDACGASSPTSDCRRRVCRSAAARAADPTALTAHDNSVDKRGSRHSSPTQLASSRLP